MKHKEYDVSYLRFLGYIRITYVGEENMYFVLQNGTLGFCKVA